jgi:mono/diheme cytochrome c family protein
MTGHPSVTTRTLLALLVVAPISRPATAQPSEQVEFADQGWTADHRREAYRVPPGSRLIPYDWFVALEQPFDDQPFGNRAFLERFRLLWDTPDPVGNPDGLPLGFVRDPAQDGQVYVGITCAACHTSQVEYRRQKLRLDGGPGLIDYLPLVESLADGLRAASQSEAKWSRFAAKVLGPRNTPERAAQLRRDVRDHSETLAGFAARNRSVRPAGFGRIDAFGMLANEVLGTAIGVPENYRACAAPVAIPPLWGVARLDWVQWNGSVQSPAARNLVEVMSGYGLLRVTGAGRDLGFETTAKLQPLDRAWQLYGNLRPPAWPEGLLGKINADRANRGAEVYRREGCAKCHAARPPYPETAPNKLGKQFVQVVKVPLSEVKTDPSAATAFADRTARPGRLALLLGGRGIVPGPELFFTTAGAALQTELTRLKLPEEELARLNGYRQPVLPTRDELLSYRAAPLAGVWATAPYLHNGSVPSLYQLFLPPRQRAKTFYLGGREVDPKHVGFDTPAREGAFEFRTEDPGNLNAGHEYGTAITDEERWALIEYLKTL